MAKIFHAEDELSIRRNIKRKIEGKLGHNVTSVSDGKQAVKILVDDNEKFDLIILDNRMPELTGLEVIRILRDAGVETPAILFSGDVNSHDMESYIESGFQYAVKKLYKEKLLSIIESALSD